MVRDGLLTLAKASAATVTAAVRAYLASVVEALSLADQLGIMARARELDVANAGLCSGVPLVARYNSERLLLLRTHDEDEWAYVLGCALALQELDLTYSLQESSPWPRDPLLFVHYGCDFLDPPICSLPLADNLSPLADRLIGPQYRTYDADCYLIIFGHDGPEVRWLECGLSGVTGPRSPQVPSPLEAA